jgi:hypothetical protein
MCVCILVAALAALLILKQFLRSHLLALKKNPLSVFICKHNVDFETLITDW